MLRALQLAGLLLHIDVLGRATESKDSSIVPHKSQAFRGIEEEDVARSFNPSRARVVTFGLRSL